MAALGGPLLLSAAAKGKSESAAATSRVVLLRDENILDSNGQPQEQSVLEMLDKGLMILTQQPDSRTAWRSIAGPEDVVGLKSNGWRYLNTTVQVEQAIRRRILECGVRETHFSIDDHGVRKNPVFQNATVLINARPMRAHHWAGVGSLIKNYIMFLPNPASIHPDSCADLATIWQLPHIQGKTRLNVLVMFTPQFHCVGPHNFNPRYVKPYHGILLGFDPVAVDSVGLRIIEGMRRDHFGEERPLNPPAKHISLAESRHHLGISDPKRIELIKSGYDVRSYV